MTAASAAVVQGGGDARLVLAPPLGLSWAPRIAAHVALVERMLVGELDELGSSWAVATADTDAAYELNPPAQLRELVGRGGKRTRPVMTFLGWVAADGHRRRMGYEDVLQAAAAIELLHCFALVHDDVMDESQTRRGWPTVHDSATQLHADRVGRGSSARFGDSIGMLVGDLAHSEADRLAAALPPPMRRIWQQLVLELIAGQLWDVTGTAAADRRVEFARSVARQKTGYYTVARPLQLGAAAAGAGDGVSAALAEYGRHAGEAFALRDDLLGMFGDPQATGKPVGDDLRAGKPTVLLAIATTRLRGRAATAVQAAGSLEMTDAQVQLVRQAMLDQGVVDAVESMIDDRVGDALAALRADTLSSEGISQLTSVVDDLARRGR